MAAQIAVVRRTSFTGSLTASCEQLLVAVLLWQRVEKHSVDAIHDVSFAVFRLFLPSLSFPPSTSPMPCHHQQLPSCQSRVNCSYRISFLTPHPNSNPAIHRHAPPTSPRKGSRISFPARLSELLPPFQDVQHHREMNVTPTCASAKPALCNIALQEG